MSPDCAYIEARVTVAREQVDAVESLMESQGALAVTLKDVGDDPILEPGVNERPLWPRVAVSGLFGGDAPRRRLREVLSLAPGVEQPERVSIDGVEDRDWVTAWKEDFGPMRFGERLWIAPHDAEAPSAPNVVVRLDPGLAFGTGTHPSTRLCMEWIDGAELRDLEVLDFGCGSGVLAIAAARLGARRVRALDHDPQAVAATEENARRNGVSDRLDCALGDRPVGEGADVVLANILAGVLIDLAPGLGAAVRPGGWLVMAGILEDQVPAVTDAYAAGFPGLEERRLDGWALLSGRRVA